MIYRMILKNKRVSSLELHYHGENMLAYGLHKEKGIVFKEEVILKNSYGKPYLKNYPNIYFNISHSMGCIVCIISDKSPVGIDVERIRRFNEFAAKKVCTQEELSDIYSNEDSERQFFRYWTLKESYVKAIGKGISHPMKDVNFKIYSDKSIHSNVQDFRFILIEDIDGFVTAVCYKTSEKGSE